MRIMRMNAPEWYLIVFGCIAATINGAVQPTFAVMFSEIIGVGACVFTMLLEPGSTAS